MNPPFERAARLRTAALCGLLACGLPAAAQLAEPAAPALAASAASAASTASASMSIAQVIERLASTGYRDIKEVERKSDKLYEVKTRDAKGRWVELYVDARSGEVLRTELDD